MPSEAVSDGLSPEQRAAALRSGVEVLGSTLPLPPMTSAVRFVLLDVARQAEADLRTLPVLRPEGDEAWFTLGEGSRSVRERLGKPHERAAWLMLDGRPHDAQALVAGLSAGALRHRLRRFADWIERTARCPRLASAVRCIEVAERDGVMSAPRAQQVITR